MSEPTQLKPCPFCGGEAKRCDWTQAEDGYYETGCGNAFEFTDGTVTGNKFRFCPYCGGEIRTQPEPQRNDAQNRPAIERNGT